jgi:hypothetical protein
MAVSGGYAEIKISGIDYLKFLNCSYLRKSSASLSWSHFTEATQSCTRELLHLLNDTRTYKVGSYDFGIAGSR